MDTPALFFIRSVARCWQCGAPGSASCAFSYVLVASPDKALDALGHPVERGKRQDKVKVRVPRCSECRSRNRVSAMIVVGAALGGAIAGSIMQMYFWPELEPPKWFVKQNPGVGGPVTGIVAVIGFVIALFGVAAHRRRAGFRPLGKYSPIVMLKSAGWREDMS